MSENSKIEWTKNTFNPWWGCQKIGAGCEHCYAERQALRFSTARLWGPGHAVRVFGDRHWAEPLRWDRAAARAGKTARVFCGSMSDVFEDYPLVTDMRERLWTLITETPNLTWMLLTKRPENIRKMFSPPWPWNYCEPPRLNVWTGGSVSTQEEFNRLAPWINVSPAPVRFISLEPLLGPIDVFPELTDDNHDVISFRDNWVIVGGESGPNARPMHPSWVRTIRDQCQGPNIPFFFKQWGRWGPSSDYRNPRARIVLNDGTIYTQEQHATLGQVEDRHKNDWTAYEPTVMMPVGKKAAGRLLDGREWNEIPLRSS